MKWMLALGLGGAALCAVAPFSVVDLLDHSRSKLPRIDYVKEFTDVREKVPEEARQDVETALALAHIFERFDSTETSRSESESGDGPADVTVTRKSFD